MPTIEQLDGRPCAEASGIADLCALYAGGHAFRARIKRFMPRRPDETDKHYDLRVSLATYINYYRTIVNFLGSYVFTDRLECVSDPAEADDAYAAFLADADGGGTSFADAMKAALVRALVERRHWLLVDFPKASEAPATRADWDAQRLGAAYLCSLSDSDVIRFRSDGRGALEWAVVKRVDAEALDPLDAAAMVRMSWTIYRRDSWERYGIEFEASKPPAPNTQVPLVESGPSVTPGVVPLVRLELPVDLWLGDHLRDPMIESFRARNALSFSLARTCYAMRNFFLEEPPGEAPKTGVAMGNVYGKDDRVEWDAPPSNAYDPAAAYVEDVKNELFRVANNMALGVNNNAAAVGRSADSKAQDAAAMTVVAQALGAEVVRAAERVMDLVALGRGDQVQWQVQGLDTYTPDDVPAIVDAAVAAESLTIPSPTFARLHKTRVALALVPGASAEDRKAIADEIQANVSDEEILNPPAPVMIPPPKPAPKPPGPAPVPANDEAAQ